MFDVDFKELYKDTLNCKSKMTKDEVKQSYKYKNPWKLSIKKIIGVDNGYRLSISRRKQKSKLKQQTFEEYLASIYE